MKLAKSATEGSYSTGHTDDLLRELDETNYKIPIVRIRYNVDPMTRINISSK